MKMVVVKLNGKSIQILMEFMIILISVQIRQVQKSQIHQDAHFHKKTLTRTELLMILMYVQTLQKTILSWPMVVLTKAPRKLIGMRMDIPETMMNSCSSQHSGPIQMVMAMATTPKGLTEISARK